MSPLILTKARILRSSRRRAIKLIPLWGDKILLNDICRLRSWSQMYCLYGPKAYDIWAGLTKESP